MLSKQAKGEKEDDDFHAGLNASKCRLQCVGPTLLYEGMGILTFVWDSWFNGLCTGFPVIDSDFDPRLSHVLLIPSFSFGLCFLNI